MPDGTLPPFEFVVGNRPEQLKGYGHSHLRSHVSRRAWKGLRVSASSSSLSLPPPSPPDTHGKHPPRPKRRPRKNKALSIAFEYAPADATAAPFHPAERAGVTGELEQRSMTPQLRLECFLAQSGALPIDYQLGGGRVDPFHAHPGPWRPFIPALTDHYIVHMAVDIAELDEPGHAGLLRTRWFPMVLSDPSTFAVVLLLSAANYVTTVSTARGGEPPPMATIASIDDDFRGPMQPCPSRRHLLHLKQAAIGAINIALSDPGRHLSDEIIGAVAKMASFEAMHGDLTSYHTHMEGLRMMIRMRGGLSCLGLGGLLRRMIVWIDLNASFLLGTNRYFPSQTFAGVSAPEPPDEPNPARFIAIP
ncbi:fungal specific transcription factor [Hirsutella rhossiliensis]|uniref:Fungal specific transcription factor domain-containing protein n=1 Tax=Hirsutella rhossiliensis TaxID=111463 RepID=A0A9P8N6I5_9HYPO|nr:fungal specific transcription factor domain-containing protein [Hirsutella rhossiliensis]KAH0968548.1 fungal specific transcription factor domain-containing protein [Hirsutella rhossiliensis]